MKKLLFVICATALLGMTAACVDPVERVDNPNYDPIKDAVTTQFVINIAPAETSAQTKQSAESVQRNRNFRGLGNATLFTVSITKNMTGEGGTGTDLSDGKMIPWVQYGDTHLKATSYIPLSTALLAGAIDPTGQTSAPKSRRVIEISVPRNTNAFLFYGEAVTGTDVDALNAYGGIQYQMLFDDDGRVDLASINSRAIPRLQKFELNETGFETTTKTQKARDYETIETIMVMIINRLFMIGVNGSNGWDGEVVTGYTKKAGTSDQYWNTYNFGTKTETEDHRVALHWKDFKNCKSTTDDSPLNAIFGLAGTTKASNMEVILGTAYNAFTTMKSNELRSGSGGSTARQATDLYSVMLDAYNSAAMSEQEEVAKVIVNAILNGLELFFDVNSTTKELTWKPLKSQPGKPGILAVLQDFGWTIAAPSNSKYTLQDFPFHFELPMGAVTLLRANEDSDSNPLDTIFYYNTQSISLSGMGGGTMSVYDYTYPPSLTYYGNSPVRISKSNDLTVQGYPDGVHDSEGTPIWENNASWSSSLWDSSFGHVTADTRGVAMAYNIQYGNALLETSVKYASDLPENKLEDNYHELTGEDAKTYSINGDGYLALRGILIGGQPAKVGWTYMGVHETSYTKMIYDKAIDVEGAEKTQEGDTWKYLVKIPSNKNATAPNYTVVYDNYNMDGTQSDVYVALEFVNYLGSDFWGNANMIRNGGTFYILGRLQLSKVSDDAYNAMKSKFSKIQPPYDVTDGVVSTKDVKRIFVQNHITKATFVIDQNSLKYAYVTVPDLRATKMSIGLSVDLEWKSGVDFGEIILGPTTTN